MELWRQAYMGYEYKGKRVLKPAARILVADFDSISKAIDKLKQNTHNMWVQDGKYTYCGLRLFDNEAEANEVVFDINNVHI